MLVHRGDDYGDVNSDEEDVTEDDNADNDDGDDDDDDDGDGIDDYWNNVSFTSFG